MISSTFLALTPALQAASETTPALGSLLPLWTVLPFGFVVGSIAVLP